MRRYLAWFTSVCAAFILLSSCSTSKPAAHPYSSNNKTKSNPRYLDNVSIGSKGGNKIKMDVGNKERQVKNDDEDIADNREILNKQSAGQQSVEIVEDTEAETPQTKKAVAAEKPATGDKKRNKHKKRETTPSIDLDAEPLVDVVPLHDSNLVVKNPVHIYQKDLSRNNAKDDASCLLKYSGMLCSIPQALTNLALYKFIDEWYGVDYRMGGNDKDGIDCSAFVQRLYQEVFGLSLVRTAIDQFNYVTIIQDFDKLKEGDLVFFHVHSKHITHVGIYLMNQFFVHASSSQGVVISSLNDSYWRKYFAGAGDMIDNYAPFH